MRDREELVRRWQAGWSVSRGWTTVEDDNDGILTVRAGEENRAMEYVVLDADDKPERVERAAELALAEGGGRGAGWITLATDDKEARIEQLEDLGLEVQQDQDWLMTIQLSEQPALKLHERYALHTELESDLIITRATLHGGVVSSGRMAVVGEDAVADRIETDPAHRRRGLGSAVMASLVETAAAQGAKRGILIASIDGLRLYRSLGWKVVADIIIARSR
ncbi:N-acetyltransferase [Kribbella pittospori]|uniref:N-acetyltransferase n=2 Tax=Kribbella TaxID=182639 RepID=A0A4R0JI65_9ACTN|nr:MULTISPECIES: GNAT family N-acetyltransferase [Kribbella]TCC45927.1 N-acetyltransferase [Kribbella capetownensis]TCC64384.1 N-acetyltransferase [Kribbella pittospori]